MQKTVFLVGLWLLAASLLPAARTRSIEQRGFEEIFAGKLENLSLDNTGVLRLAPSLEEIVRLDDPVIWAIETAANGDLIVGTGNEGQVLRITRAGQTQVLFDSEDVLVRGLAIAEDGVIYAGTSPGGRVYRLQPGGRPEIFFDPPESYIWQMRIMGDELFVATGGQGRIYRVPLDYDGSEMPEPFFRTDRDHVTLFRSLADGSLLAAASPDAILYGISPEGSAEVLYNSGTEEISDIAVTDDGQIFFSTINNTGGRANFPMELPALMNTFYKKQDDPDELPSFLFELRGNGFIEPVWSPGRQNIFSFQGLGEAGTLIGTEDGHLFRLDDLSEWQFLQKAPRGGEINDILPDEGGYLIATSNPAAIYRLSGEATETGTFTSEVLSTEAQARWGRLRVLGPQQAYPDGVSIALRAGDTKQPDADWTSWMEAPRGEAPQPLRGRFLQYRLSFENPAAEVRSVEAFYTLKNGAPIISRINILPVAVEIYSLASPQKAPVNISQLTSGKEPSKEQLQEPPPTRQFLRFSGQSGYISAGWMSFDPNGDLLTYDIYLRGPQLPDWMVLGRNLRETAYSLNTRGMADGYYQVKVSATDAPSNPPGEAKHGEKLSQPFLVDNTSPTVSFEGMAEANGQYVLRFTAEDALSVLVDGQYWLNGAEPAPIEPVDGIYDSQRETFSIKVPSAVEPGDYSVILEVVDQRDNRGVRAERFTIP